MKFKITEVEIDGYKPTYRVYFKRWWFPIWMCQGIYDSYSDAYECEILHRFKPTGQEEVMLKGSI